jgi:hypothetical protein
MLFVCRATHLESDALINAVFLAKFTERYRLVSLVTETGSSSLSIPQPMAQDFPTIKLDDSSINLALIAEPFNISIFRAEEQFSSQTSTLPTVRIRVLPEFSQEVKHYLDCLQKPASDDDLYTIADKIAEWLSEASDDHQTALAAYLPELPTVSARTLLSAFGDAEVTLTSAALLGAIARFVYSEDGRLSQAAAACLLICGGETGKLLMREILQSPSGIPHARLVQGIVDLVGYE